MNPETKAWIQKLKREFNKSSLHTRTLFEMAGLIKLLDIVESQEKEIERLKEALIRLYTKPGVRELLAPTESLGSIQAQVEELVGVWESIAFRKGV